MSNIVLAPTTTSVDEVLKLQLREIFDVETAEWLLKEEDLLSRTDKTKLKAYYKRKHTGRYVDVTYVLSKKTALDEIGRFYCEKGIGLQNFPREIRSALARRYYWDIDIANCQPNLLWQLCEKNNIECPNLKRYCMNRDELLNEIMVRKQCEKDEAKTYLLKCIYQGSVDGLPEFCVEIKREARAMANELLVNPPKFMTGVKDNRQGKVLGHILQDEEKKCMKYLMNFLHTKGRPIEVLIHDGGFIRKLDNETSVPTSLLLECANEIFNHTGYKLTLLPKPFDTTLTRPDNYEDQFIPSNIQVDDTYAARRFTELMGEYIIKDEGIIHIFDDNTGIWSDDERLLRCKVTQSAEKLIFKQRTNAGEKTFNYSGIVKNTNNLLIKLPDVLPSKDGYFMSRISSDKGKLLFKNGIYNFETGEFSEGFNHEIVFRYACPRDFPTYKDTDKIDYILRNSFIEPFNNQQEGKRLLHNLMRSMIGDWRRKTCLLGLGPRNSGKSLLAFIFKTAFGSFVETFEANSLLVRTGSEANRELLWTAPLVDRRIVFSSEIKQLDDNKNTIDGNMLKKLTGGSDTISYRPMYSNRPIIKYFRPMMCILANDIGNISPNDSDTMSRFCPVNYTYTFIDNPTKPYHKIADSTLKDKYSQDSYGDALVWLIIQEFETWKSNGFAELPEAENTIIEDMSVSIDVEALISNYYDITGDVNDTIPRNEIQTYLKRLGVAGSSNRITRELKQLGCEPGYTYTNRQKNYVYTGIRQKV